VNGSIVATVSGTLPISGSAQMTVAEVGPAISFAATLPEPGAANLTFTENFKTAFLVQIDTPSGPFTIALQDSPSLSYNTESQFTPCFTFAGCTSPSGLIGLANTGTELLARITQLGSAAATVSVPNQLVASDSVLSAYLIVGGKPVAGTGYTPLSVSGGSVDILYDITEYNGFWGYADLGAFTIPATLFDCHRRFAGIPGDNRIQRLPGACRLVDDRQFDRTQAAICSIGAPPPIALQGRRNDSRILLDRNPGGGPFPPVPRRPGAAHNCASSLQSRG